MTQLSSLVSKIIVAFQKCYTHKAKIYRKSIEIKDNQIFFMILDLDDKSKRLIIIQPKKSVKKFEWNFIAELSGIFTLKKERLAFKFYVCPCNHNNAIKLRQYFPFTKPKPLGLSPAIGTGDRLGLATPGHIQALKGFKLSAVLAQQSIREMERTRRNPDQVIDDVSWLVFLEGFKGGFGADADHLKRFEDVKSTFKAGFTMYTIDPSDYVNDRADSYSIQELQDNFNALPWKTLKSSPLTCLRNYAEREWILSDSELGSIKLIFTKEKILRAAVKYGAALAHTYKMYRYIKGLFGENPFDLEISVDETESPTSPHEHFYIVSELKRLNVKFQGLALKFTGKFEKAVDYIGCIDEFENEFRIHVIIAKSLGPYKLSIHSGSDKFSIYPILGKIAGDLIHLKTSGTSYLEALRIIARHDPSLFREIVKYSITRFDEDRKSYHVSLNLSTIPNPNSIPDEKLEDIFLNNAWGRQLLHITYGSILTAEKKDGRWLFRDKITEILISNEDEHYEAVASHIRNHIKAVWGRLANN